jgi:hypothetical protein
MALYTCSPHELRIYLGRAHPSFPPTQQCLIDYVSAQLRTMVNVPYNFPRTNPRMHTHILRIDYTRYDALYVPAVNSFSWGFLLQRSELSFNASKLLTLVKQADMVAWLIIATDSKPEDCSSPICRTTITMFPSVVTSYFLQRCINF